MLLKKSVVLDLFPRQELLHKTLVGCLSLEAAKVQPYNEEVAMPYICQRRIDSRCGTAQALEVEWIKTW